MTVPVLDYDPAKDAHDSYFAAVEAKRLRGDTSWPDRPPLDHVPETASPSPWLFRITIACAVFWAAVVGAWWWWS